MKKAKVAAMAVLVVAVAVAAVYAAPSAKQVAGKVAHKGACVGAVGALNLTADQKAQAKKIWESTREQVKAVREDTSLTREQRTAKIKEIHQAAMSEFRGILTPKQQTKFDAAVKNWKSHKGDRHTEMKNKLERIAQALKLTDQQRTEIKQIFASHKTELKSLKDNTTLTREQKMEQFKQMRTEMQSEVRRTLTPDQQKKFDDIMAKLQTRIEKHMAACKAHVK